MRRFLFLVGLLSVGLAASLATAQSAGKSAADCEAAGIITAQLECHLERALAAGDPGLCEQTEDPAVRFNCIALYAERRRDPTVCGRMAGPGVDAGGDAGTEAEAAVMQDACIAGVAAAKSEPGLCSTIALPLVKDSCYTLLVTEHGADPAFCAEVVNETLRQACEEGG